MKIRHLGLGCVLVCLQYFQAAAEPVEEKFPDGKIKLKFSVDDQKRKDGLFTEFFASGKQKVKATYKTGELEGAYTEFFENGKVHITATYKNDKRTGTYTETTEKGLKKLTAVYKDGKLNGTLIHYEMGKPGFAHAFKDGAPFYGRTFEQIKKQLAEIEAGPREAEKDASLRRLKAYRYLVEIPYENMALDAEMNRAAEAGCKLCAMIKRIDHAPPNPGLSETEYKLAFKGTSNCNLAVGHKNLTHAVDDWMDDSDATNIDCLGHRRWCINPMMQKTGFGQSGNYMAMWSSDSSQKFVPDYHFVCYPARGFMPVQYFGAKYAWNISLNAAKYKKPDKSVRVSIHEVDEILNKTNTLKFDYFHIDSAGFGIPNCIIFRPVALDQAPGKRYLVEVKGIVAVNNLPMPPLRYLVEFVSIK